MAERAVPVVLVSAEKKLAVTDEEADASVEESFCVDDTKNCLPTSENDIHEVEEEEEEEEEGGRGGTPTAATAAVGALGSKKEGSGGGRGGGSKTEEMRHE